MADQRSNLWQRCGSPMPHHQSYSVSHRSGLDISMGGLSAVAGSLLFDKQESLTKNRQRTHKKGSQTRLIARRDLSTSNGWSQAKNMIKVCIVFILAASHLALVKTQTHQSTVNYVQDHIPRSVLVPSSSQYGRTLRPQTADWIDNMISIGKVQREEDDTLASVVNRRDNLDDDLRGDAYVHRRSSGLHDSSSVDGGGIFGNETTLEQALSDGLAQCSDFRLDPLTQQVMCVRRTAEGREGSEEEEEVVLDAATPARILHWTAPGREGTRVAPVGTEWSGRISSGAPSTPFGRVTPLRTTSPANNIWPRVERRSGTGSQVLDPMSGNLVVGSRPSTFRVSAEQMKRFLFAQQALVDAYGHRRTGASPFVLAASAAADGRSQTAASAPATDSEPEVDTDGSPSARKREQKHKALPGRSTTVEPIDSAMDLAGETPLECQMRQFSFTATKTDPRTGHTCTGLIVSNICYGGCDTGEISDWLFPHKKSIHKVCRHGARVRRRALLTECSGEDVDESTKDYHYVDARTCVCQKCTSADTACLGSLTRPNLPAGGAASVTTASSKQQQQQQQTSARYSSSTLASGSK